MKFAPSGVLGLFGAASTLMYSMQAAPAATLDLTYVLSGPALSGGGLVVAAAPDAGGIALDIRARESVSFDLFTLWTDEHRVDGDDLEPESLFAAFSLPQFGATASIGGQVVGHSVFFDIFQWGSVSWDAPVRLSFGQGGVLSIALGNALFNFGFDGLIPGYQNGAAVRATVTYVRQPAGVPLPAAGFVLLGGLGAVALLRHRT